MVYVEFINVLIIERAQSTIVIVALIQASPYNYVI